VLQALATGTVILSRYRLLANPEAALSYSPRRRPYFDITTLKVLLVCISTAVLGAGLIYLGGAFPHYWKTHAGTDALVDNLGALLVISVALGLLWELLLKRSFARELLETVNSANDLDRAGIIGIGIQSLQGQGWDDLFRKVTELDIFVAYGNTWRNTHLSQLQDLAKRRNARVNVYLADPNDDLTMKVIATRTSLSTKEVQQKIIEAKKGFEDLKISNGASIEVYYFSGARVFTLYRFNDEAVIELYQHAKAKKSDFPTLICRKGGTFYDFLEAELAAIKAESAPSS
jgi:hypothetical protein